MVNNDKYALDGVAVYYFKLNIKKVLTEDNVHRVSGMLQLDGIKWNRLKWMQLIVYLGSGGRHGRFIRGVSDL